MCVLHSFQEPAFPLNFSLCLQEGIGSLLLDWNGLFISASDLVALIHLTGIEPVGTRGIILSCSYHVVTHPSKKEGICDLCGGELYQRADDSEETVKTRLQVYADQTSPLIEYYTKSGKNAVVDGNRPVQDVFETICALLGE